MESIIILLHTLSKLAVEDFHHFLCFQVFYGQTFLIAFLFEKDVKDANAQFVLNRLRVIGAYHTSTLTIINKGIGNYYGFYSCVFFFYTWNNLRCYQTTQRSSLYSSIVIIENA